jgi:hypothetical protein
MNGVAASRWPDKEPVMRGDSERFREWDRRQWASEVGRSEGIGRPEADRAASGAEARWNKAQWVGEDQGGRRSAREAPEQMLEGEPGISGNRHNPGVQAWASPRSNAAVPAGDELQSTQLRGHLRTELVPWDDSDFVRKYEGAHEQVVREGLLINGPRAAARLEELMRAAGYPRVSVKVERTIDEALRHAARWTVRRDGAEARGRE